jgi:hypothetical protein
MAKVAQAYGGRHGSPACWTRTPLLLNIRQWFTVGVAIHSFILWHRLRCLQHPATVCVQADSADSRGSLQLVTLTSMLMPSNSAAFL